MNLLLWRHAEAESTCPDQKRKLTPHGEEQARKIARWIHKHVPGDLHILSSPALRCMQTAQALELPFETDERLAADSDTTSLLLAVGEPVINETENSTVLAIGHQPLLGQTAALLLSGKTDYWTVGKSVLWWFSRAPCGNSVRTVLRAVVSPNHT